MLSEPLSTRKDIDELADSSISFVEHLLIESGENRRQRDKVNRRRFARLLKDRASVELTMSLTDEVMRITSIPQAAKALRHNAQLASIKGLGLFDFVGLKIAAPFSKIFPGLVMPLVHWRVRAAAKGIILPAESAALRKHIEGRNKERVRLNINVLGEAVLGDLEANARLSAISELISRPEVNYASVKISSIVSQLITIDHVGSVKRAASQLRFLYRQAVTCGVFINLDMEEFRDLRITVDAFKEVLSEPEFSSIDAGIVLQAYLPESHAAFTELIEWAIVRHAENGGGIKIRLVKGANLAMEKAEAELHGWVPAPYSSKAEVDASYARLIDLALRPEYAKAIRIGVASHNLFDVAWAIEVARLRGVEDQLDIEMLEGMANAEALAVAHQFGRVLLYTPVTQEKDFPSAVAYLVRRLDENTSMENYLRASFDLRVGNSEFIAQRNRFMESLQNRHLISTQSKRHLLERHHPSSDFQTGIFQNQSDGDPTNSEFRVGVQEAISIELARGMFHIPIVINGEEVFTSEIELGVDSSAEGSTWYEYCVAGVTEIDRAIKTARGAMATWSALGAHGRGEILVRAALTLEASRAKIIAVMSRDAGKTFSEADPEVSEGIDFARYYAMSSLDKESESTPLGVVLIVPPWNFPFAITLGGVCAALATGNTVILKPAPETVATSYLIAELLWSSGVPQNVLQFVPTRDDENGQYLVSHAGVNAVILTGSFDTALMFTKFSPHINLLAETSGKNAIYISASADIDNAVKDLVHSAFGHAGQKCSAASLAIVDASIYRNPAFISQLKDAVESLQVGAGPDFSTSVGSLIHPPSGPLLRALTILDEGESWLLEPRALDANGYLYSPGVKMGVSAHSWSHLNEWFGPVLAVIPAPDFATAVNLQNDTDYGLTAGIHSLNTSECEKWINSVAAGNLYINRGITGAVVNRQPFGGWKRSSVGATSKAGGPNYLNNLRNWSPMQSLESVKESSKKWWDEFGSQAIDAQKLSVERNYQRYRPYTNGITVFIDSDTPSDFIEYVKWISELVGTPIFWAAEDKAIGECGKVRWLSSKPAPTVELLERGISLDRRPIASRGEIEAPRWLLEQSVSITNHRYGNVGAGPIPKL
ncbi:MAG: bifunctional proline dehydrogenase/L-glutamate gamma-semialdehyde dehydrogenase [Candidatus Planktophila sp.]|nr:bifunctional proline dehydrogenase/L-glutamate gamma-semialdehyde dehydrogenase [Candidatus Planktophila sp.]